MKNFEKFKGRLKTKQTQVAILELMERYGKDIYVSFCNGSKLSDSISLISEHYDEEELPFVLFTFGYMSDALREMPLLNLKPPKGWRKHKALIEVDSTKNKLTEALKIEETDINGVSEYLHLIGKMSLSEFIEGIKDYFNNVCIAFVIGDMMKKMHETASILSRFGFIA